MHKENSGKCWLVAIRNACGKVSVEEVRRIKWGVLKKRARYATQAFAAPEMGGADGGRKNSFWDIIAFCTIWFKGTILIALCKIWWNYILHSVYSVYHHDRMHFWCIVYNLMKRLDDNNSREHLKDSWYAQGSANKTNAAPVIWKKLQEYCFMF